MIWPQKFKRFQRTFILRTIPSYCNTFRCNCNRLSYPTMEEFDFQSILFNHRKPCRRARIQMHPFFLHRPVEAPSLIVISCNLSPIDRGHRKQKKGHQYSISSKRTKGKILCVVVAFRISRFLGNRRNDDAPRSTAANTPRLIRLEGKGWSFLSTLLFGSSRVVAWLRANASRFSGVDSPTGERMKRKEERRREEGIEEKYFSPSSRGKNRGVFKGDGFLLSFEERSRRELSTNFHARANHTYFREWVTILTLCESRSTRVI